MKPLINILTRTSNRPNYFAKCRKSITEQTYTNIKHIVSVDNEESKLYVNDVDKIINVSTITQDKLTILPKTRFAPYNLYLNDLLNEVDDGLILILDDDDAFIDPYSLELIVSTLTSPNDLMLWRVQFPDKLIPEDAYWTRRPVLNHFSMIGFCFHSKWKDVARFDYCSGSDFRFINKLWDIIPTKLYFDMVLTKLQRSNYGGFGKKDDL